MNRILSTCLCLALLVIIVGATAVRVEGSRLESSPELLSAPAAEITFAHFYILRAESAPLPWWQTSTLVDRAGGVHTAFFTSQSIHYAYCPSDCTNLNQWSETPIAAAGGLDSLDYPTLALDASNHPSMMWYIDPDYVYAECNASCTNAASWKSVTVPVASRPGYTYPQSARYFTLDSKGRPRFVCYANDYDDNGAYNGFAYTTCDGSCSSAASWHSTLIDLGSGMNITHPQILFNAKDQPRVMGLYSDPNYLYKLIYLGCDANCAQSASWSRLSLYEVGQDSHFSFRLDSQDRPRVAYYTESTSDQNLYYAWSTSPVVKTNAWLSASLALPPNDYRTVDLAIDSLDRPRMAFASTKEDLDYVECTSNCGSPSGAVWRVQHIETADELNNSDPIPAGACISSTWMMDGYPSLALDGADRPSVSYFARHYKMCLGGDGLYHILHDVSALRFATAGAGPVPGKNKVYLPLVVP